MLVSGRSRSLDERRRLSVGYACNEPALSLASCARPILHQLINLYRNQTNVIREVFGNCELLNLGEKLIAELVGAKAGSLAH
jgi:hypothetical protein